MNTLRKMLISSLALVAVFGLLLAAGQPASARINLKPNLVISSAAVGNGSGGANDWELFVTVRNTNAIASTGGSFKVEFTRNPTGAVSSAIVPALGPGQSATIALQVAICDTHGTLRIDTLNQIDESNEADNRLVFDNFC